ncbi:MAG: sugar phosphate isomerase/epimerase family protein [Planctomycetota bacterium]
MLALNDGTQRPPRLRCDLNAGNLLNLPPESRGPRGDLRAKLRAVKAAGFEGVQGVDPALCRELGLGATGGGRVDTVKQADEAARRSADAGVDCVTLHVGTGLEDDRTAERLIAAVINASEKRRVPMYIETHRATITQDLSRTVQFARRHPGVRFNGDFSHWYTGLEMVYGDFERKLDFLAPVFERVRFVHGRIGNPGSMQVDIGDGKNQKGRRPYVDHFRALWTRSFRGFLKSAKPGDYLCFTPELLPANIYYARLVRTPRGQWREECDRWLQALLYVKIAKACFAAAQT